MSATPLQPVVVTVQVPGIRGPKGESAYQEWLAAGNTGTREQFLASLKGKDGDPIDVIDMPDLSLIFNGGLL